MKRIKLVLLPLVVAGLSFGVVACGDDDDDGGGGGGGETSLDLVIGDSVPLSGDLAAYGPPGEKAATIAVEDVIQSAIEDAGVDHTVELLHEDNCGGADPQCAVQAARKLLTDGASCMLGAWSSTDTISTAESVTVAEEIPMITPASTRADITTLDDDGFLNRTAPGDNLQAGVLADVMDEELGGLDGQTVSIGARNDAYGTGFVEFLVPELEERGATVNEPVLYDVEQPSYDSEATDITAGNPDVFVIVDYPEPYNEVAAALERTGNWSTEDTFITDGLIDPTLAETAGAELVDGLRGTAPGTPESGAAIEAFDTLYNETEPTNIKRATFDAQNFDAAILCYLAAVAAGSTEGADISENLATVSGPPGDKYTFEELPEAIEAIQNGDDIDFEGASGPIDLDENGDPSAALYSVNQFQDGEIVPIGKPISVGGA